MADSSGWITIKQMTNEILYETDRDLGFYKKCMHHVINGVREMHKFHIDNVKTTKVTASSVGAIDFPSDYISFIGLYIDYGGLLWSLTRQDKIIPTTTTSLGAETLDSDIGEGKDLDTGGDYKYATSGGKNDYYYKIDEDENRILVRNIPTRTLFLQYISSGIDLDDGNDTQIPVKIKEALKMWVMYRDSVMSKNADKRLATFYENEYNKEVSKLRFLELPTADELKDILLSTYSEIRR